MSNFEPEKTCKREKDKLNSTKNKTTFNFNIWFQKVIVHYDTQLQSSDMEDEKPKSRCSTQCLSKQLAKKVSNQQNLLSVDPGTVPGVVDES